MDRLSRDVIARLPLAEAVLLVWSHLADETFLSELFEDHRGRCYQKVLTFPVLVSLIAEALLEHGGSGRQSFERAAEDGQLPASIQAAYGKLGRLPIPLSEALLAHGTERLRASLPEATTSPVPPSLDGFSTVILDGKAIKRVARRLKPLRGVAGGVLGGKALVALTPDNGLAVAMSAHPDGEANDIRLVPEAPCRRCVGWSRGHDCGWPTASSAIWSRRGGSLPRGTTSCSGITPRSISMPTPTAPPVVAVTAGA